MRPDSIWHCFRIPAPVSWAPPITVRTYMLLVVERIRLRRSERRYARRNAQVTE